MAVAVTELTPLVATLSSSIRSGQPQCYITYTRMVSKTAVPYSSGPNSTTEFAIQKMFITIQSPPDRRRCTPQLTLLIHSVPLRREKINFRERSPLNNCHLPLSVFQSSNCLQRLLDPRNRAETRMTKGGIRLHYLGPVDLGHLHCHFLTLLYCFDIPPYLPGHIVSNANHATRDKCLTNPLQLHPTT